MKYNVKIKGTYWNDFEVVANSEEEACDKAQELFEELDNICGEEMLVDFEDVQEI